MKRRGGSTPSSNLAESAEEGGGQPRLTTSDLPRPSATTTTWMTKGKASGPRLSGLSLSLYRNPWPGPMECSVSSEGIFAPALAPGCACAPPPSLSLSLLRQTHIHTTSGEG